MLKETLLHTSPTELKDLVDPSASRETEALFPWNRKEYFLEEHSIPHEQTVVSCVRGKYSGWSEVFCSPIFYGMMHTVMKDVDNSTYSKLLIYPCKKPGNAR